MNTVVVQTTAVTFVSRRLMRAQKSEFNNHAAGFSEEKSTLVDHKALTAHGEQGGLLQ